MKTGITIIGIIIVAIAMFIGVSILNLTCGTISGVANVAQKELNPQALLKKYEWFKNASSELDKKMADIEVYSSKVASMEEDYSGKKRFEWDRVDKETMNIWQQELAGTKASYNSLAAEYNSQMSKINWAFCNVGKLPPGAVEALPRAYREYQTK